MQIFPPVIVFSRCKTSVLEVKATCLGLMVFIKTLLSTTLEPMPRICQRRMEFGLLTYLASGIPR